MRKHRSRALAPLGDHPARPILAVPIASQVCSGTSQVHTCIDVRSDLVPLLISFHYGDTKWTLRALWKPILAPQRVLDHKEMTDFRRPDNASHVCFGSFQLHHCIDLGSDRPTFPISFISSDATWTLRTLRNPTMPPQRPIFAPQRPMDPVPALL